MACNITFDGWGLSNGMGEGAEFVLWFLFIIYFPTLMMNCKVKEQKLFSMLKLYTYNIYLCRHEHHLCKLSNNKK